MDEIAMHILDVAMNAVAAGGRHVGVSVVEDAERDRLEVCIADDGKGMDAETVRRVLNGFASEKTGRSKPIGLGLAFLRQTAETCDGGFEILSEPGQGTEVRAWMELGSIDRPPLGDLDETIFTLSVGAPDVDVTFTHRRNGTTRRFDSASVRETLEPGASLQSPAGIRAIRHALMEGGNEATGQ